MFAVYSNNLQKVIAYHTEKRVVKHYKKGYLENSPDTLIIKKISENKLPKDYGDLYLVKYGDDFIQYKYLETVQIDLEVIIEDCLHAHDVLQRIAETSNDKKKTRSILKADTFVLEELEKAKSFLYSVEDLERRRADIERWKEDVYHG